MIESILENSKVLQSFIANRNSSILKHWILWSPLLPPCPVETHEQPFMCILMNQHEIRQRFPFLISDMTHCSWCNPHGLEKLYFKVRKQKKHL